MNVNNKKDLINRIKVNKILIRKKSENNFKNIKTPSQTKDKLGQSYKLIKRNLFLKKLKNLYHFGFEANENKSRHYSQRTYTCKYLLDDISYNKGNIIYDMQKNKYLKPIFDSKDFYKKMIKCKIDEPLNLFFHKNEFKRSFSALTSPRIQESLFNINNNFKIKNEKTDNNHSTYLLNNLKEFNSNFRFRNTLNYKEKRGLLHKSKEILNNLDNFNNVSNVLINDKSCKTCRNFYSNKINFYEKYLLNKKNLYKYNNYSNRIFSKSLKEKIENFCIILETFFLNIIKRNFKKFLNKLDLFGIHNISKVKFYKLNNINSETSSRKNTFYDTETLKNSNNDKEVSIKINSISNLNFFNFYETNKIINDDTKRFDRDIIGNSKEKKFKETYLKKTSRQINNKDIKINLTNSEELKSNINNNNFSKNKKIIIFKKIIKKESSEKRLIYQKKINFLKNDFYKKQNSLKNYDINKSEYLKNIKNKTLSFSNFNDNIFDKNKAKNILLNYRNQNVDKKELNSERIENKKLFIYFRYYTIRDKKYYNIYNNKFKNKYKNKEIALFDKSLKICRNTNFSIILNKKINVYRKIAKYKKDKLFDDEKNKELKEKSIKTKRNDDNREKNSKNNNKVLLNQNYFHKKEKSANFDLRFRKINMIIINCMKFLIKIITKIYLKKKFQAFKKSLNIA